MDGRLRPERTILATAMIGLGILGIAFDDFAWQWQPVAAWVPGRPALAYAAAIVMLAGGVALLFTRTAAMSARILFPYFLIWLLLKVPAVVMKPQVAAMWEDLGEIAVVTAGAWVLFARAAGHRDGLKLATGETGIRIARFLFAASLVAFGLSHFAYVHETAALVPAWLPARTGWVYLTGAGHLAAGVGVLFSVHPRLAAMTEAGMLTVFTILVWIPAVLAAHATKPTWTEFAISWAVTAGAWAVARSIPGKMFERARE